MGGFGALGLIGSLAMVVFSCLKWCKRMEATWRRCFDPDGPLSGDPVFLCPHLQADLGGSSPWLHACVRIFYLPAPSHHHPARNIFSGRLTSSYIVPRPFEDPLPFPYSRMWPARVYKAYTLLLLPFIVAPPLELWPLCTHGPSHVRRPSLSLVLPLAKSHPPSTRPLHTFPAPSPATRGGG